MFKHLKGAERDYQELESESASEEITQKMKDLKLKEDNVGLMPSAGYRSETTIEKPEEGHTYAGIPVKINEKGGIGNRWPTAKTALRADIQRLELLETLTSFIGEANNRR